MLIGVGYGRTLEAIAAVLPERSLPDLRLVSLMGSLTRARPPIRMKSSTSSPSATGAQTFAMPAPFMANTIADRDVLLNQHDVAEALALAGESDLMLVGVGATDQDPSLVSGGMIEPGDMDELRRLGAVGEMLGHFFAADGRPIETELTRRIVTLPIDRVRGRRVVAIAGGAMKVEAVRAVLASGLLHGLITDERTARSIIEAGRGAWRPTPRAAAKGGIVMTD